VDIQPKFGKRLGFMAKSLKMIIFYFILTKIVSKYANKKKVKKLLLCVMLITLFVLEGASLYRKIEKRMIKLLHGQGFIVIQKILDIQLDKPISLNKNNYSLLVDRIPISEHKY
jgi:hypothetical protein